MIADDENVQYLACDVIRIRIMLLQKISNWNFWIK